ncbi:reverse transcriptase domain-containing protein [Tanacetum coccineum]
MFKQLRLEIGLKDALVEKPKFNKWLSSLLRNKEKLEEIAITTKLGLEALTPTRMTLELANRSITHPMGIAEDVVVRVDGFTFLADFVVVNFEPDPRVPIILGRPFLRTAKALIDLYEETLTLRVGKEELMIRLVAGNHYSILDDPSPSSSPVKTSDNFEKFADELALLDSLPPGNDNSTLKKVLHEENFQVNLNPLFDEIEENVEIKNSNVSDEPVLLNTPLSDKVECFAPEDNNDEIDDFLAMEVSSNFEEGYFDSEGDVTFLDNLLSDDASHNLASEVISDHEPEQNESSITFSLRSASTSPEFAVNHLSIENDDSEDEVNESPNLDHQDDPSIPRPPPEPPDIEKCFKPEAGQLGFVSALISFKHIPIEVPSASTAPSSEGTADFKLKFRLVIIGFRGLDLEAISSDSRCLLFVAVVLFAGFTQQCPKDLSVPKCIRFNSSFSSIV